MPRRRRLLESGRSGRASGGCEDLEPRHGDDLQHLHRSGALAQEPEHGLDLELLQGIELPPDGGRREGARVVLEAADLDLNGAAGDLAPRRAVAQVDLESPVLDPRLRREVEAPSAEDLLLERLVHMEAEAIQALSGTLRAKD